nr:MAG TPA: hypothetical protein [Caudoviricetes sp.]
MLSQETTLGKRYWQHSFRLSLSLQTPSGFPRLLLLSKSTEI